MANGNGFKGLSKSFEKLAREAVEETQDEFILGFAEKITQPAPQQGATGFTPVKSGRLMANTILTYRNPTNKFSWDAKDPSGRATFKKLTRETKASPWSPIYIQNNTPYNIEAENKGWFLTGPYKYFVTAFMSAVEELEK